jgi:hypothetical protein
VLLLCGVMPSCVRPGVQRCDGYEKNKTLIAMPTQHAETYGDNRSPILAAFQNTPKILMAMCASTDVS